MGGVNRCDVLIVGGGLAGCSAAAELAERFPRLAVRVVDAGGGVSTEVMGFSAPVEQEDSPERFFDDTLRNAGGEGDPRLARVLADRALPELRRLEALGIAFDRTPDGAYDTLRAAGTSCPRVVHCGTSTGREVLRRLGVTPERRRVSALLLREGRVAGARFADGETIHCSVVLLAGGGFAGLWRFSSWNKLLRGDALLFARSAGAALDGLGLVQYEPTVTVYPEALCGFPVITTVLNAGARLLDREGNSLLALGEPVPCKRELARRIAEALAAGRGWEHGGIRYDFSGVDEAEFARKYPGYYRKFRRFARSFRELFFEVKPGAHTTLGGIRIEPDGSTAVPGLFAAGECVGNLHGCDRLGGNAGLEVLVFGRIAGASAGRFAAAQPTGYPAGAATVETMDVTATPPELFPAIGAILDRSCGVLRSERALREGLQALAKLPVSPHGELARLTLEDALTRLLRQSGAGADAAETPE